MVFILTGSSIGEWKRSSWVGQIFNPYLYLHDHLDHDGDHPGRFIGGRKKSGSVGQRAGRPPASAASSTNV